MQELGELLLHGHGTPCHCREEYELGELVSYQTHDKLRIVNSKGDGYYTVTGVGTLFPRCNCPAGRWGRDCKHIIIALEASLTNSTAVALRPRQTAVERATELRMTMAAEWEAIEPAVRYALFTKNIWPSELKEERDQEKARDTAALIILTALGLGIPAVQAFSYITVIKGKPFLMARMVSALVNSRIAGGYIGIVKRTALECEGIAHRPGRPNMRVRITIEDAKTAGWFDRNPNYKSNPAAMLSARVTTTLGWLQFSDVLANLPAYGAGEFHEAEDTEQMPSSAILPSATEGDFTVLPEEPEPADTFVPAPSSTTQSSYPSTFTEAFGSEPGLRQGSFPTQGEGHVVAYPELGTAEADVFWDGFVQKFRNVGLKGADISAVLGKPLSYAAVVEVLVQTGMSTEELIEAAIEKVRA